MSNERIEPNVGECRHSPVGESTRLIDHFRYWFIFTKFSILSFSYTVGLVKCTKCGAILRIPKLYYYFLYNLLYMACNTVLGWGALKFLTSINRLRNQVFLLTICYMVTIVLIYFLVDRTLWFLVMHLCKWESANIEPQDYESFIQKESYRFLQDRKIKHGMYLLGLGLGSSMIGTPPRWYASYLLGLVTGILILISVQVIDKHRRKR